MLFDVHNQFLLPVWHVEAGSLQLSKIEREVNGTLDDRVLRAGIVLDCGDRRYGAAVAVGDVERGAGDFDPALEIA